MATRLRAATIKRYLFHLQRPEQRSGAKLNDICVHHRQAPTSIATVRTNSYRYMSQPKLPGQKLPISGKGAASLNGWPIGDLMLEINVTPNIHFRHGDKNLFTTVKTPFTGAYLGTTVTLETLEDSKRIKAKPGSKIRLKGFGVPRRAGETNGDLYAAIDIEVPQEMSEEQKVLIEQLRDEGV